MEAFRSQGIKGVVYSVLVAAIGVVFILQFNPAKQGSAKAQAHCAAEVKGRCASVRDFNTAYALIARGADESANKQHRMKKVVSDGLVERELLAADAERLGLRVSDDEVSRSLRDGVGLVSLGVETPDATFMAYQLNAERPARTLPTKADGKFDEKTYNKTLRSFVGRTQQEWREMQTAELVAAHMRDLVRQRVRVGDEVLYEAFQQEKATVGFKYVKIDRQYLARNLVISDEQIAKYLADPKTKADLDKDWEKAKITECRKARHILVKADKTAKPEEIDAAKKAIEKARERVKKGDKFEDVAREVSQDPGSARRGGSLGCFPKGMMVKPFDDAAFSMKPGELSNVIETEYGFHVIKLEAIAKDADAELEWRKERAQSFLMGVEAEAKTAQAAKELLADVSGGKSFEEAVAALIAKHAPKKDKDKKKDGEKKDGEKKDGEKKDGEKKDAPADEDPDLPVVRTARGVTRTSSAFPGAKPEVNSAVFALDKAGAVPPNVVDTETGYAIVQLVEKKPATREDFDKERDNMGRALIAKKRRDALAQYVLRLKDAAKNEIKVLPDVLKEGAGPVSEE